MKIILTGATGYIGSNVLDKCIQDPEISSILVLSRRELPADKTSSDKVKVIIHWDFKDYPDSVLEQLQGAEACIWCIGGIYFPCTNVAQYTKANVDFTTAAATAFATRLAPQLGQDKAFRFVYLSSHGSKMDQQQTLWYGGLTRKSKGRNESAIFQLAEQEPKFEGYAVRPGVVFPSPPSAIRTAMMWNYPYVVVGQLAERLVQLGKEGASQRVFRNYEIAIKA